MSYFNFNLDVVEFVAAQLEKHNIPVLRTEKGTADIGPGFYDGKEGFYFRHPSIHDSYDTESVSNLFPMGVAHYTVFLADVSFAEVDDDRIWPASIGLIIVEDED